MARRFAIDQTFREKDIRKRKTSNAQPTPPKQRLRRPERPTPTFTEGNEGSKDRSVNENFSLSLLSSVHNGFRFTASFKRRTAATRAKVPLESISTVESCLRSELDRDYRNAKAAKPSFPEIDRSETGVSGLQNGQERLAWRRIYARRRDLLLPGVCRGHRLHMRRCRNRGLLTSRTKAYAGRAASGRAALRRAGAEG